MVHQHLFPFLFSGSRASAPTPLHVYGYVEEARRC
jgi:hypothetical protein